MIQLVSQDVVLLDEAGNAVGAASKTQVHDRHTPLHLAFSCYVFDLDGRLLLSQRAMRKATFPGLWTNTACGHPAPGEPIDDAVRRRVGEELGVTLTDLRLVIPEFRYTAEMDGVRENEMCPVWTATTTDSVVPDPREVEATRWVAWGEFSAGVADGSVDVSPWCRTQVEALDALGTEPAQWPAGDPQLLPPAAQLA